MEASASEDADGPSVPYLEDHNAAAALDGLEELKPLSSEKAQSTPTSVVQKPRAPSPTLRVAAETSKWKESITHLGRSGARVLGFGGGGSGRGMCWNMCLLYVELHKPRYPPFLVFRRIHCCQK